MRLFQFLVLAAVITPAWVAPAAAAPGDPEVPYIVVYKPASAATVKATTADIVADTDVDPTLRFGSAVQGFAAKLDHQDIAELRDNPQVAWITKDLPVRATGLVPVASGDSIPTGVQRTGAADGGKVRTASSGNVAVIDTGIDLTHPDLNAVPGKNCTPTGTTNDENGHGTHVAGTIAARNNGSGAIGIAPGTKLFAVRVLDANGSGSTSGVICGIDWVTSTRTDADPTNDIAVANMSLGGNAPASADCGRTVGDAMHIAICNSVAAGVTYVVAAGNSGADEQGFAPASYPEVLTVTAVSDADGLPGAKGGTVGCVGNPDDSAASYSNYATRAVDVAHTIAAPGSCIRSTWKGGGYATLSGTSMAAPHVTGLVALCQGEVGARGPCAGKSPADVRSILLKSAADQSTAAPASGFAGDPTRPTAGRVYGYLASARFLATPATPATAPVNTIRPSITGTATVGQTLTATSGTWTGTAPITFATQWQRCTTSAPVTCADIAGAAATTYAPTPDDVGRSLRARVSGTNAAATVIAQSDPTGAVPAPPVVLPANSGGPVITGSAVSGQTLTATSGTWTGTAPITYATQWQRCTSAVLTTCTDIAGATAATFTTTAADVTRLLRVRVTATNTKGSVVAFSAQTAAIAAQTGPPVPSSEPTITGTVKAGAVLTASPGTWTGASPMTFSYAWASCAPGSVICYYSGVVAPTMVVPVAPAGTRYVFVVTARNAFGTAFAMSRATVGLASTASVTPLLAVRR